MAELAKRLRDEHQLYDTAALAEALGVEENTLQVWRKRDRSMPRQSGPRVLPPTAYGRGMLWTEEQVQTMRKDRGLD